MTVRDGPPQPAPPPKGGDGTEPNPPPYPAEKARGGTIILRTRAQRVVFIAGLVGIVLVVLLTRLFA
jgi:hypothetical protein